MLDSFIDPPHTESENNLMSAEDIWMNFKPQIAKKTLPPPTVEKSTEIENLPNSMEDKGIQTEPTNCVSQNKGFNFDEEKQKQEIRLMSGMINAKIKFQSKKHDIEIQKMEIEKQRMQLQVKT